VSSIDRPLRIGVTASLLHADPARPLFAGRPLAYLERSMFRWVGSQGALAYLVPPPEPGCVGPDAFARDLDGLVVTGGVDVAPGSYGQAPRDPAWAGDRVRDAYELALVRAFYSQNKPIFGVCRGHQVLNVAFGGTLVQDLPSLVGGPVRHRDPDAYHRNAHPVEVRPGSQLAAMLGASGRVLVNSVHHQAVERVADGFDVDARAVGDEVVEAISLRDGPFAVGVQWHPEFVERGPGEPDVVGGEGLLAAFLAAARERRD
jgi:putative glutamine amidotransferase